MGNFKNRLTYIGPSDKKNTYGRYLCEYKCECGSSCFKLKYNVDNGITASCGCIKRSVAGLRQKGHSPGNALTDPTESSFNALFVQYKCRAKNHSLPFELNKDQFRTLTSSECFYCGVPPHRTRKQSMAREGYVFNGIDRLNNSLGYISNNCVPCCKDCNYMKSSRNFDEFLNKIVVIASRLNILTF